MRYKEKYGARWEYDTSDFDIEKVCIRNGGKWINKRGVDCGLGLFQHYKNIQSIMWPNKKWHRWNELLLHQFTSQRIIGVVGPGNSGKSHEAGMYGLTKYICFPECTTILVSSTDSRSLELRIWGEIKKYWAMAKSRIDGIPGYLRGSKQMITTDSNEDDESQDFRNGIIGIPCLVGGNFVGLGKFVGIKNTNVLLLADEASFMHKSFSESISNLNKNEGFQCVTMGNPKDRTDPLGIICEPHIYEGGWDGIGQPTHTRTWRTRFDRGICVNLVGTDSPNFDVPEGQAPPFPFLITRRQIQSDLEFYGKDSLQFQMMNLGVFPSDSVARRIITRTLCTQFGAFEEVTWEGSPLTHIGALDAAYGSVGGDRCIFIQFDMGVEVSGKRVIAMIGSPVVVPVTGSKTIPPEDQIAQFVTKECLARNIPPQNLFYDSTGRGTLGTAFARIWSTMVNPVEFGGRASERPVSKGSKVTCRERYSKFVSELWYSVRAVIEARQFRQLHEEALNEGCMKEWTVIQGNRIEVESKIKTKIRMGRSPDIFDAVVVGVEGCRRRGFEIDSGPAEQSRQDSLDWLRDVNDRHKKFRQSKQLALSK